ncbi:MAG: ATP-binding cassette domain-containing protein [Mesorhizobium sp.]|nr:MAG: ATP-binding cassette domain-containing protein [Mesorhizobium sp.]
MLEVSNATLHYGAAQALRGVSLKAGAGKITCVLGRNGVGKTSLMRSIVGHHRLTSGSVAFEGKALDRSAAYDRARSGIAFVPQGREVFPLLTVRENLETGFAPLKRADCNIPAHVFELFPVLRQMLGRRGGEIILVWHYLTFDLLFPALLSLTLVSLLLATGRRLAKFRAMAAPAQSLLALVLVLPYTLADYAQNLAVARLLSDFQSANPDSLAFASALTVTKFALLAIPVVVIAVFYLADQRRAGQGGERP